MPDYTTVWVAQTRCGRWLIIGETRGAVEQWMDRQHKHVRATVSEITAVRLIKEEPQ